MDWVLDNLDLIGELTLIHLRQSILAIVIGFVLSVPLGWVAFRFRLLRSGIITVVGLLYTIPSLALLMILPTIFGYSAISEISRSPWARLPIWSWVWLALTKRPWLI